jgi:hypothetical protein
MELLIQYFMDKELDLDITVKKRSPDDPGPRTVRVVRLVNADDEALG